MTINRELKSVITTQSLGNMKNKLQFPKYQADILKKHKFSVQICFFKLFSFEANFIIQAAERKQYPGVCQNARRQQGTFLVPDQLDTQILKHLFTNQSANALQIQVF